MGCCSSKDISVRNQLEKNYFDPYEASLGLKVFSSADIDFKLRKYSSSGRILLSELYKSLKSLELDYNLLNCDVIGIFDSFVEENQDRKARDMSLSFRIVNCFFILLGNSNFSEKIELMYHNYYNVSLMSLPRSSIEEMVFDILTIQLKKIPNQIFLKNKINKTLEIYVLSMEFSIDELTNYYTELISNGKETIGFDEFRDRVTRIELLKKLFYSRKIRKIAYEMRLCNSIKALTFKKNYTT